MTDPGLAAHLEALNLAGLGFAASRLLGKDPQRVTGQFTMWARQDLDGLPSLTTGLWRSLAPLGLGRPALEPAAVCNKLLRGRHGDARMALQASRQCTETGKDQAAAAPLVQSSTDTAGAFTQQQALVKDIKEYWRAVGTVYGEVRARVVTGEHDRAVRMVYKAQKALQPLIGRIAAAASAAGPTNVAVRSPAISGQSRPQAVTVDARQAPLEVAPTPRTPRRQPTPLGDRTQSQARAEAFARAERLRVEADADADDQARPVEVLSTKPVRNHVFAPIVFLLVVAAVALLVIFFILNSPNPLSS